MIIKAGMLDDNLVYSIIGVSEASVELTVMVRGEDVLVREKGISLAIAKSILAQAKPLF